MAFPQEAPPQVPESTKGAGARSTKSLNAAFAGPINRAEEQFASIDALREHYEKLALRDNAELQGAVASYYGITGYSPDYTDAPVLSTVESGPGGLPGSPYFPNVASPGEGNVDNPTAMPEPPEASNVATPNGAAYSGAPITANDPKSTSEALAGTKVGQGVNPSGRSAATP